MSSASRIAPEDRIPLLQKIMFSLGQNADYVATGLMTMVMWMPFSNIGLGLSPVVLGLVLMVLRAWDMISDPIMGNISENARTRWGRRRPFMFVAAITTAALYPLMWHLLFAMPLAAAASSATPVLGVLQSDPARAEALARAGVSHVVLSVSWDRFQTVPHRLDSAYVEQLRADTAAYHAAGLRIVLDTGIQYPPAWLRDQSHARYHNQHGDAYIGRSPGKNIVKSVFNELIRDRHLGYIAALFQQLGTEWAAVRLGGGWYGELNYLSADYAGKRNAYWAYDPIAQSEKPGLPAGMRPCPVPGWKPGASSPDHASARAFLE